MSNIADLKSWQKVRLDLVLSGMVDPEHVVKVSKIILDEEIDESQEPFKAVPENPSFMNLTTVTGGININLKKSDVSAFFEEEGYTKIITDKMDITAHGTVEQFKSFMKKEIDEWGRF